jgi:hypothetical protein
LERKQIHYLVIPGDLKIVRLKPNRKILRSHPEKATKIKRNFRKRLLNSCTVDTTQSRQEERKPTTINRKAILIKNSGSPDTRHGKRNWKKYDPTWRDMRVQMTAALRRALKS